MTTFAGAGARVRKIRIPMPTPSPTRVMTSSDEFFSPAPLASLFFALLIALTFLAPNVHASETTLNSAPPKLLLKRIARYYQAQLNDATEAYFQNFPDLDRKHTRKLKAYIAQHYPLSTFTAEVLPLTDPAPYHRAAKKFFYRHGTTFKKLADDTERKWSDSVCYAMQRLRGIYVSKYIEKDVFKEQLFASCKTHWEVMMAGSNPREVNANTLGEWAKELEPIQAGDRFFYYSISFWIDGVEGIFQVRNQGIIKSVTTFPPH
jgi:hypothetical protein